MGTAVDARKFMLCLGATFAVGCGDDDDPPDLSSPPCFVGVFGSDPIDHFVSDGPIRAIDVVADGDGWLCVLADQEALHTARVSPDGTLTRLGAWVGGRNANAVAISADRAFAYVASRGMGFQVVTLADLSSPDLVPTTPDPAAVFDVDLAGDVAFVAGLSSGLVAFDISEPEATTRAYAVDTPGTAREVAAAGRYVVIADEEGGLPVVDVTLEPPAIVTTLVPPSGEPASDVHAVHDNLVLASAGSADGLIAIELDPEPRIVGTVDVPSLSAGITSIGETAYVAANDADLVAFDVSTPSAPVPIGYGAVEGAGFSCHAADGFVYLAGSDGAFVIDGSDLTRPPVVPERRLDLDVDLNDVLVAHSGRAFVAHETGITSIDYGRPGGPVEQGTFDSETNRRLAYRPPLLYSASVEGVLVVHVSFDESFFAQQAWLSLSGAATDIALADTLGFVADGSAGVQVLDIREPASPWIRLTLDTPGTAQGVAYGPPGVCVVADGPGIAVIDVRGGARVVGDLPLGGFSRDVAVRGAIAYVARAGSTGFSIVDVSDPTAPVSLGDLDLPSSLRVELIRDYALVFTRTEGVVVLDISTPSAPSEVGRLFTRDGILGIAFDDPDAFVFDENGTVEVWKTLCTVPSERSRWRNDAGRRVPQSAPTTTR